MKIHFFINVIIRTHQGSNAFLGHLRTRGGVRCRGGFHNVNPRPRPIYSSARTTGFFFFFLNTDFCFLIQNLLVNQYVKEKGEKSLDVESGTKEDGSSIHVQSPSDKDGNGEDGRFFIVKIFNLQ